MATDRKSFAPLALLALLALAASLLLVAATAPEADAKRVAITSPANHSVVKGTISYAVRAGAARKLHFLVDGRRRAVRRAKPLQVAAAGKRRGGKRRVRAYARILRLNTRALSNGRHRLTVVQRVGGEPRSDTHLVIVRNPGRRDEPVAPKPAPREQAPAGTPGVTWQATFEGPSLAEWTSFDRDDGGTFHAVEAAADGIPAHSGTGVGHFEVTAADRSNDTLHSKVYKSWGTAGSPELRWEDDADRPLEQLPSNSPGGIYAAWFYLPADYRAHRDWTNVLQFKESYTDADGDWQQDPQWWVTLTRADSWGTGERPAGVSGADPVLAIVNWGDIDADPGVLKAAPRGRWFELRADLQPGRGIDWYVDGQLWQRSEASRYPVGISKARPSGWTFGVGHYGGLGKLWVDDASFSARS